jgi:hypothetical protein
MAEDAIAASPLSETKEQSVEKAGILNVFINLFANPTRGFASALALPRWTIIIPLALVIGCTFIINVFYYRNVDLSWLGGELTRDMSAVQRDAVLRSMSIGRLMIVSGIGIVLFTLSIDAIRALFFWLVLKIRGQSQSYGRLFAVTVWAGLPLLLLLPAGLFNIALSHGGHLPPNDVNPVSANQLLFHFSSWTGFGRMLSTISIVSIWELVLLGVGLKVSTGMSNRMGMLLAFAPDIIVYGLWALSIASASGGH